MLSKFASFLILALMEMAILIGAMIIIPLAFIYFGLIIASFVLMAFVAMFFGVLFLYAIKGLPQETFVEQVYSEGVKLPRRVIIADSEGTITFNEMGDLVRTQYGSLFFYGHPLFGRRRILWINQLNNKEILNPIIYLRGVQHFVGNGIQYIETDHPVYVKGKSLDYASIRLGIAADEQLSRIDSFVAAAVLSNPQQLKQKGSAIDITNMLPKD